MAMKTGRLLAWFFLFSLTALMVSGCGSGGDQTDPVAAPDSVPSTSEEEKADRNVTIPVADNPDADAPSGQNTASADDQREPRHEPDDTAKKTGNDEAKSDLEISASDDGKKQPSGESGPTDEPPQPFDNANLTLFGISIGDSVRSVTEKFGNPLSSFYIDDDIDQITVFKYDFSSIGFNRLDQVEFIDVTSDRHDPGLNGLRLGDSPSDAVRLLGEPDVNTEYVLNYVSESAILKMDVDPVLDKIISIKLFAAE